MLNPSGSTELGDFVSQQLALIMRSSGASFKVIHWNVKSQPRQSINECGPLCVAYATHLALTGSVSYADFTISRLRPHLRECLLQSQFKAFPVKSEVSASKRIRSEVIEVYCSCRLPASYDANSVKCSKCREWCHFKCHGVVENPSARRWLCNACRFPRK